MKWSTIFAVYGLVRINLLLFVSPGVIIPGIAISNNLSQQALEEPTYKLLMIASAIVLSLSIPLWITGLVASILYGPSDIREYKNIVSYLEKLQNGIGDPQEWPQIASAKVQALKILGVGVISDERAVLIVLADIDPDLSPGIFLGEISVQTIGDHFAALVIKLKHTTGVKPFEFALETEELDLSVVVEHLDPDFEVEQVPMRIFEEGNFFRCVRVSVYPLALEGHINHFLRQSRLQVHRNMRLGL